MPVPNTFANATTSIPLSQLDANFATAITLGNTSIQLGNTVTTLNNMTFANVTVSSGSVTVANVTVTGVGTFAAGSNTAPSITTSGDTNTGFFFPAADTVATTTGGTERMRVDSSGNVGIGTSSPTNKLSVDGSINASNYYIQDSSAAAAGTYGFANSNGPFIQTWGNSSAQAGALLFATSGSERARIDSSGNLLALTSSTLFASSHAFVNSGAAVLGLRNSGSTAGKYWQVGPDAGNSFKVYNQNSVGMFMSDGSTSWSSSSDERQKNIIEPISNAVAKVGSLRAVIGSYKSDQENKRRSFLIAQDVEQALPEAVTTAPDGFLGVAYTDVIPLLVAAIQELKAENDDLKARLTALETK